MKKTVIYICLILFVVSCKQFGKPDKPDNLIPEGDMVTILIDLSLLSSAKGVNRKILENEGISPEEYVYKTHNIDSLQFLNSNRYYAYNTDVYTIILNRVGDSLKKLKVEYNKRIKQDDTNLLNAKAIERGSVAADSLKNKSRKMN